jgi:hypothetical protein
MLSGEPVSPSWFTFHGGAVIRCKLSRAKHAFDGKGLSTGHSQAPTRAPVPVNVAA